MKVFDTPIMDRERPGNDVSADSMEEARAKSYGCPFCCGQGLATVFHVNYDGHAVATTKDDTGHEVSKVMRTVVYCSCAAGMKTSILHQQSSKGVFQKLASVHDVLHERYPHWTLDDPTTSDDDEDVQGMSVAQIVRSFAEGMKVRKRRNS